MHFTCRYEMRSAVVLPLIALSTASCTRPIAPPPLDRSVVEQIAAQYPTPVSLSPDGSHVLTKTRRGREFEIAVVPTAAGPDVDRRTDHDSQLCLTWRPDSHAVAYLADRAGDRHYSLYLWEPFRHERKAIPVPATGTAAPPLRWSPDGKRLMYFAGSGTVGQLILIDLMDPLHLSVLLQDARSTCDFEWSPRGDYVAAVSESAPDSIVLINAAGVAPRAVRYPVVPAGEVRELAWAPDGGYLLATVRRQGEGYFELDQVDLHNRSASLSARADGDILAPRYLNAGTILYEVNETAGVRLYCQRLGQPVRELIGPDRGNIELRGDGLSTSVLHRGLNAPPELYALVQEPGGIRLAHRYAAPRGRAVTIESPETTWIASVDHTLIPIHVWRPSQAHGGSRGVVVLVHGGPHLEEFPIWNETAAILNSRGFDLIAVNYRGSSGFGFAFENQGDDKERARDVEAACDYAIDVLHAEPDHVVLLGSSYGSYVAALLASESRKRLGGVVLLSIAGDAARRQKTARPPFRIRAFHGANDPVASPSVAFKLITNLLGQEALVTPGSRLEVFDDEGHQFRSADAWARVYTQLLMLLGQSGL